MPLSSFWDIKGRHTLLEGVPYSEEHWSVGDEIDQQRRALLDRVELALASKIVSVEVRADSNRSLVLEVETEDGRWEIVRAPKQGLEMFKSEVALLAWLKRRSLIPVPRLHCVVRQSPTESHTFAVMEKLPGDCLMNVFGGLSYEDKESVIRDMAKIMLQLNELAVPQRIGSTLIRDDEVTVIPRPGEDRVFDSLEDYMYARIELRRKSPLVGSSNSERARARATLHRLASELPGILASLSSLLYRRCVVRHDDLQPTNVLVNGNRVSGIIDWEYHSTIPLVLAAKPPSWIRYDGVSDPRFVRNDSMETWWIVSPEDAAKLRTVYSETIKAMNEEYWRIMEDGNMLQQIDEWLSDDAPDPGCARLAAWMNDISSDSSR